MARVVMLVPQDRSRCGRAVVLAHDGRTLLGPFRVLATASRRVAREHGNPERSPLLPFGHPPEGSYAIIASLPPGTPHRRSRRFGGLGALLLEPRSGTALEARGKGRRRFALHGGPADAQGRLRPTRGGLRVADEDLAALLGVVNSASAAGDPVTAVDVVDVAALPSASKHARRMHGGGRLRGDQTARPTRPLLSGALVALAAVPWMPTGPGARTPPRSRRAFLQAIALLAGALGMSACGADGRPPFSGDGTGPDRPSPVGPSPHDPGDAGLDASGSGCNGATSGGSGAGSSCPPDCPSCGYGAGGYGAGGGTG